MTNRYRHSPANCLVTSNVNFRLVQLSLSRVKVYMHYLMYFIEQFVTNLCKDEKSFHENERTIFEFSQRQFLDASTHLYKRIFPSARLSRVFFLNEPIIGDGRK